MNVPLKKAEYLFLTVKLGFLLLGGCQIWIQNGWGTKDNKYSKINTLYCKNTVFNQIQTKRSVSDGPHVDTYQVRPSL